MFHANLIIMATPPNRNTANTNATTNQATIVGAADQAFIDGATAAILDAISLGLFQVTLTTFDNCDLKTLHDYFVGLGYVVSYPGLNMLPGSMPAQPAELFGIAWDQFWMNFSPSIKNPARVTISWQ